ncbi:MAG: winged helix-turn-helix domain-containing protein [Pyrinomonadaceae bacterium]
MLYQNEQEISLGPKVIETLLALVERRGEVLGKDELMQLVWTDSIVEEGNLSQNLYLLRKTLGDGKDGKPLIETLRRRGYRFVAEVRRIEEGREKGKIGEGEKRNGLFTDSRYPIAFPLSPNIPLSASQTGAVVALANWRHETDKRMPEVSTGESAKLELAPVRPVIRSKRKYVAVVGMGLILATIGLGSYFFSAGKTVVSGKKTIAVLPLVPINSAKSDEIYEVGIADALIQKLRSMQGFVVRPLSAIRKYAGVEQDPLAAGREQRVGFVLTSTYQLADGKIRATVQIVNVASGNVEKTYTCEKDTANFFTMEDAIADDIGNKLLTLFATTATGPAGKLGTTSEEAYRLYLQGMYLYDKRTPPDAQKAVELLEQAIQIDPNYAQAWAAKAHVHRSLGNFSSNTHEEYRKSIEAISRALELDENLADAHSALCENKFFYERDFVGAELECQRSLELYPNSPLAHQIYSRNLMVLGRFDESIAEIKTAIDLEPTSLFSQRNFGIAFYYARRYAEAVSQFKRVIEMDPNFEAVYPWLVNSLKLQGNDAEAFAWFMKWQAVRGTDDEAAQTFRTAFQKTGWPGVENERVKRFDESKIRTYFMEACMAAQAGNHEKAIEYLENSSRRREWGMAYLRIEPALDILRGDPNFDDIVRRVDENQP